MKLRNKIVLTAITLSAVFIFQSCFQFGYGAFMHSGKFVNLTVGFFRYLIVTFLEFNNIVAVTSTRGD